MTTTTDTFRKEIAYDRETRDFRATLDGNYIGHFANYSEAEVALDAVAYDLLMDGQALTATDLDGGSDADQVAEEVAAAVVVPAADVLSSDDALTLLDAINTAHQNGLDTTGTRGWLAGYGYKTKLSAMTGAWVPDGNGHGWRYVTGERITPAEPRCPYCDDTGLIPNGSGTGDQSGGWADTCECQDPEPPTAPTPAPYPSPLPPIGPYPLAADALLVEADRVMAEVHYAAATIISRPSCPYCLGPHHPDICPLRRPTHLISQVVRARTCGNCGGEHHIQLCPEIRAALFAQPVAVRRPRTVAIASAALLLLIFVMFSCDNTCTPRNDGSLSASACVSD